jgi:hypothetical protein
MMMISISIAAASIIAWAASSPSSPAPAARRCAALGLDRSMRPSKLVDRAADALVLDAPKRKSTFTEISYTKFLTFPIWRAFGLQPHRMETFKLSTDPDFVAKVRDVVGLYVSPPQHAIVLCVDEKSQIQALDRSQPMLPMRPGQPGAAQPRLYPPRHHLAVRRPRYRDRTDHRQMLRAPSRH